MRLNLHILAAAAGVTLIAVACSSSETTVGSASERLATAPSIDAGAAPPIDATPPTPPCTANDQCGEGQSCVDGACEDDDGCDDGETECGDQCVDTQTDSENCGDCGKRCAPIKATCGGTDLSSAAVACVAGVCQVTRKIESCAKTRRLCRETASGAECYDPCGGKACPTPKPYCYSSSLLVTRTPTCSLGVCGSDWKTTDCTKDRKLCRDVATGGECYDACAGKTCPTPKPYCYGTLLLVTRFPTCSLGVCGSDWKTTDCTNGGTRPTARCVETSGGATCR